MNNEFIEAVETADNQALAIAQPIAIQPTQKWTPESLLEQIQKKAQMRQIMVEYMKSEMKPDHHYYSFKAGDKPALTQEGAHLLCSLFDAIIGPPKIYKEKRPDGHFSVEVEIDLMNLNGAVVSTGNGICTTEESKYAGRWVYENQLPSSVDKSTLESQTFPGRSGGSYTKYLVENAELADLYNTVLKMAIKRATVAAVRKLPLVSELFAPDGEGGQGFQDAVKGGNSYRKQSRETSNAPVGPKVSAKVKTVLGLKETLTKTWGVTEFELESSFLPEGVTTFEDLTDEQAEEAREGLATLLKAKSAKAA